MTKSAKEYHDLLDMEVKLLGKCGDAIDEGREFTEEEQLSYNALAAVQALRKWRERNL